MDSLSAVAKSVYPGDLAPWEQVPYFRTPKETTFSGISVGTQVAKADTTRSLLIFSNGSSGLVTVSTNPAATSNQGLSVPSQLGSVILNSRDHGPLVTMPWFYASPLAGTFTVFEVFANTWPGPDNQSLDERLTELTNVASARPANAGGINGRLSYRWPQSSPPLPDDIKLRICGFISKLRQSGFGN